MHYSTTLLSSNHCLLCNQQLSNIIYWAILWKITGELAAGQQCTHSSAVTHMARVNSAFSSLLPFTHTHTHTQFWFMSKLNLPMQKFIITASIITLLWCKLNYWQEIDPAHCLPQQFFTPKQPVCTFTISKVIDFLAIHMSSLLLL